MIVKKGFIAEGTKSQLDENTIKSLVMNIKGTKKCQFDWNTEIGYVTFDDSKTNLDKILDKIEQNKKYSCFLLDEDNDETNEKTIYIEGMHCASCEVLVERKLKKIRSINHVDVDFKKGFAKIKYDNEPSQKDIKRVIKSCGYKLSDGPVINQNKNLIELGGMLVIIIGVYLLMKKFNFFPDVSITDNMGYGVIFMMGLVAAMSSCLAVTGGLLLSLAARYSEKHPNYTGFQKLKPHINFNIGRILGYTLFGAALGLFGSIISVSTTVSGILTILASLLMIALGLQLIGVFKTTLNIRLPKKIAHKIHDLEKSDHKSTPFILGGLTFFLPCGFTQALQIYVLSKANPIVGALTMLAFSIGTAPSLLSVAAISSFLKGNVQKHFFKFAGVLVIVMGLFSINQGMILATSKIDYGTQPSIPTPIDNNNNNNNGVLDSNVKIVDGKQIVNMKIDRYDYIPSEFTIVEGVPVEWHIDASTAGGCAQIITVPKLDIQEFLSKQEDNIITFIPQKEGKLEFMCSMAMTTPGAHFKVVPNPDA
ncbi:hypothetical protein HN789_01370 [archaeon]|nr:hypothetical protein [archaeon]MBT4022181.1 hypothetical protein [archaeon]MBT4272794.1 hypothetical protein [archaeon]MBT4461593.1 hypothetical protein [archaeon]MBT4857639.1 hypothetical protein [archaeon]